MPEPDADAVSARAARGCSAIRELRERLGRAGIETAPDYAWERG